MNSFPGIIAEGIAIFLVSIDKAQPIFKVQNWLLPRGWLLKLNEAKELVVMLHADQLSSKPSTRHARGLDGRQEGTGCTG